MNATGDAGAVAPGGGALQRLKSLLGNSRIRLAIQLAVIAVVAIFFIRAIWNEWPKIVSYEWHIEPLYLLAGIAILLVRGPIICLGWRLIINRMGYPLSWRRALRIYFYSGMAKYMPGAIWYAVGRVVLAQQAGIPKMVTTVSIALETALVTVASILVATLAFSASPAGDTLYLVVVLIGLLVFLAWPKPWFALMNRGLIMLGRSPVTMNINGRDLLVLLPPFVLSWIAYGVISFCWTAALYPSLDWSHLPTITGVFTLSWVIGFLAFLVPNGWGVREILLISLLTNTPGLEIPGAVATGAALLSRLGSILGEAAWAAVAWRIKGEGAPPVLNTTSVNHGDTEARSS